MDSDDQLLLLLAATTVVLVSHVLIDERRKRNTKQKRRLWTQKWQQRREKGLGVTNILKNEFRMEDSESCKMFLRLCREHFNELLRMVKNDISNKDTNMRQCITAEQRLAITLRFLATGETYRSLMVATTVHESAISIFVPQVCKSIFKNLKDKYLKMPRNADEWKQIADDFEKSCNFPLCLGALDGRHMNFRSSSVVLLALTAASYKFTHVDVGVHGRISDGDVYGGSKLKEGIDLDQTPFPADIPGQTISLPYTFIADDAFPLTNRIMKQYSTNGASKSEQQIYNYRLSTAKSVSDRSFRILSNRFRILSSGINLCLDKVEDITLACCALHNFLITKNPQRYTDVGESVSVLRRLNQCQSESVLTANATAVRDALCEYVNTNAVVPLRK